MAEPFLSEIRIFSFNFPPKGWALCNGQLLPIAQNQALFSLLGTTYGGDGIRTFGLPNLQVRTAMHQSTNYIRGQVSGETAHTLTVNELPNHTHFAMASSNSPDLSTPLNAFWASNSTFGLYGSNINEAMSPASLAATGAQPHDNMSPYLVVSFCIALLGIFPSRN
jgi:microcystin-dependent protein